MLGKRKMSVYLAIGLMSFSVSILSLGISMFAKAYMEARARNPNAFHGINDLLIVVGLLEGMGLMILGMALIMAINAMSTAH